jgi:hypothetical protein
MLGGPLLGVLEALVGLSQGAPQSQRVTLDNVMGDVKEIGHAQTLKARDREPNPGLGTIADQV